MTNQDILNLVERYEDELIRLGIRVVRESDGGTKMEHIRWMLEQIRTFIPAGDEGKTNRWLGFIQGYFWSAGIHGIEDMRKHNTAS